MNKLFMVLLGCTPKGRNTEQHDVFFGIATSIKELVPDIISSWPEASGKIHIDAWREVNHVTGFDVVIEEASSHEAKPTSVSRLFFINLGGYKKDEFDEFHYKMLVAANDKGGAVDAAKQTAFYKHFGFKGATSHIDDKYGVDVDDFHEIVDILPGKFKERFFIKLLPTDQLVADNLNLGYFKLDKL